MTDEKDTQSLYPLSLNLREPLTAVGVFNDPNVTVNFNSGLTFLVGPNGSGKTQLMKNLKPRLSIKLRDFGVNGCLRYLSSNRIGDLEAYRSQTRTYAPNKNDISVGDLETKKIRHNIEVATGDFFTLDERRDIFIKVSETLSTLFRRNIYIKWNAGKLHVIFGKKGSSQQYSLDAEASGLINIISLLTALYDDEVKILLIDEPEVSLHPQLQAYLLNEIRKTAGDFRESGKKMIVVSTHSTEMIDIREVSDLSNYVFFRDDGEQPCQIAVDAPELNNRQLRDLICRLNQTQKAAFFSKRPLLLEGITDSLICHYLDNRFDLNLGVAGTQIIPLEGKKGFSAPSKLMTLIGKEPIILSDLDAFIDDNGVMNLFAQKDESDVFASINGHQTMSTYIHIVKDSFCKLADDHHDDLKDKYEGHPYWKNAKSKDENASRRAILALLNNSSDSDIQKWNDGNKWVSVKRQIHSLFDSLEKCGCFILRKGTLEDYYVHDDGDALNHKYVAALDEISELQDIRDNNVIEMAYADILRALRYAGQSKKINISKEIRGELLSELPALLNILDVHTSKDDLLSEVRKRKNGIESIFSYDIVSDSSIPQIIVNLKSDIIHVSGFPLTVNKGDNVVDIVQKNISSIE